MFKKQAITKIETIKDRWEQDNAAAFASERNAEFKTEEGIPIKRLYTPLDLEGKSLDYAEDIGFPGEYPFTRGISPDMYRGELWLQNQDTRRGSCEETNRIVKEFNELGQSRILILTDLPTQMGYDSDHALARTEVGRQGVPLSSLRDYETILEGVDIQKTPVEVQANAMGAFTIACHLALAQQRGIALRQFRGWCQNDILKDYIARGLYRFPPEHALRLVTDALLYCSQNAPHYIPVICLGSVFRRAGGNRIHEVAFATACGIAYLEAAVERGADIDSVAPLVAGRTCNGQEGFLEDIAKTRAARKVWANAIKKRFHPKNPASLSLWLGWSTLGDCFSKEEPLNNIGRGAIAALGAALAGVQNIGPKTPEEALGIPSEEAKLLAFRSGQIVTYETGVMDVVDPLAGSYYIEWLTSEYEERINQELETIEHLGGIVRAFETGYPQRKIQEDALKRQLALDKGSRVMVGFNKFASRGKEKGSTRRTWRATLELEQKRITELKEFKKSRDGAKVQKKLDQVRKAALAKPSMENNLMVPIIEAAQVYATTGEVAGVLHEVFGKYRLPALF